MGAVVLTALMIMRPMKCSNNHFQSHAYHPCRAAPRYMHPSLFIALSHQCVMFWQVPCTWKEPGISGGVFGNCAHPPSLHKTRVQPTRSS